MAVTPTTPTPIPTQDIQNSEDLFDLSNQILNSYNERSKALGGLTAQEKAFRSIISQQQKISQQIATDKERYLGYQIKSKDLEKSIGIATKNKSAFESQSATISREIDASKQDALNEQITLGNKQIEIKEKIKNLDAENEQLSRNILNSNNARTIATFQDQIKRNFRTLAEKEIELKSIDPQIEKQKSISDSAESILKSMQETKEGQQKELETLEKNLAIRKQIEKSTGLLGAISKSVAKIPGIGQYLNADEAIKEMEILAAEIAAGGGKATDFVSRLRIAGKGITTLTKGLYENIQSPEAIFSFFINAAFKANKESVNLSKNLGYGAENANRVREGFVFIEKAANNINVTTANLSEAFNELSSATGFVTEYSADALETQIKLTKQLGLSGDEAAGVYELSVLNGKSSEATYQSMLKGYVNTRNSLKVGVPFKAAIAEAAKVSGQLAANMGYNAERIISGVVATKALGTSLEQAKSQGASLLDFQSSIENELQAELITGKQLNLERARAAALMGDQVAVAEELAAQGMTSAEFGSMNVIAQDAYAKALGTTSDELANQLKKREEALASGKSLAEITAEEAEEATKRQNIQEKFTAAIEKLQSLVGNIVAGPMGSLLEVISSIADNAWFLYGTLGLISTISLMKTITSIMAMTAQLAAGAAGAVSIGSVLTGGLIAAGVAIAIGALIAGIRSAKNEANTTEVHDFEQSAYGKRTLTYPEGTLMRKVVFNDKDIIKAGTNLDDLDTSTLNKTDNSIIPPTPLSPNSSMGDLTKTSTFINLSKEYINSEISKLTPPAISTTTQPTPINYEINEPIKPTPSIQTTNPSTNYEKNNQNKPTPPLDLTPIISVMNDVKSAIDYLNNKKWDVYLDSNKVGRGMIKGQTQSA